MSCSFNIFRTTFSLILLLYPTLVTGECSCDVEAMNQASNQQETLKYKVIAIATILVAGASGVSLPLLLGKKVPALKPQNDIFFMIKAFAAGVILATGFVHILPDAFNDLTSPCLGENPWGNFPFTGFVAMLSAVGTLMIDSFATGYYKKQHFSKSNKQLADDQEMAGEHAGGHVDVHTHATHGHALGSTDSSSSQVVATPEEIQKRFVSPVLLEMGIVVHSMIIGISLGASESLDTIKSLIAASFHQFFEGLGLGGWISKAEYKSRSMAIMAIFFSVTTPVGIAIGVGISSVYKENSPSALIVEGTLNSVSAGILIYMALVDLLAADFANPRLQSDMRIQLGAYVSLLLGAGCMSVLAEWT